LLANIKKQQLAIEGTETRKTNGEFWPIMANSLFKTY